MAQVGGYDISLPDFVQSWMQICSIRISLRNDHNETNKNGVFYENMILKKNSIYWSWRETFGFFQQY